MDALREAAVCAYMGTHLADGLELEHISPRSLLERKVSAAFPKSASFAHLMRLRCPQGSAVPWSDHMKTAERLGPDDNDVVSMCGGEGRVYCGFEYGHIKAFSCVVGAIEIWSVQAHVGEVNTLVEIRGKIVSGSEGMSGNLRVWDAEDGTFVKDLCGHIEHVNHLRVVGEWLVSTSDDSTCRVWNIRDDPWTSERTIATVGLTGNAEVYNGSVIVGSESGAIHMWDIGTGAKVRAMDGHKSPVLALLVYMGKLFSSSKDKTIRVWDLSTGECAQTKDTNFPAYYMAMDGENLIVSTYDGVKHGYVSVFDTEYMQRDRNVNQQERQRPSPILCAFQRLFVGNGRWLHSCMAASH